MPYCRYIFAWLLLFTSFNGWVESTLGATLCIQAEQAAKESTQELSKPNPKQKTDQKTELERQNERVQLQHSMLLAFLGLSVLVIGTFLVSWLFFKYARRLAGAEPDEPYVSPFSSFGYRSGVSRSDLESIVDQHRLKNLDLDQEPPQHD